MPGYANPQTLNRFSYVMNNPLRYTDPTGHKACSLVDSGECDDTEEKILKLIDDVLKHINKPGKSGGVDKDGDGILDEPDPIANPVRIGSSPGCQESTYVECFYARQLLEINGSLRINKKQFALLIQAVFYDVKQRTRHPIDRINYDTPFWDYYGAAPGDACYGGDCYYRAEVNYFAQGMYSAASGESQGFGEGIVDIWKEQYGGSEPSPGTMYWFRAGYVLYHILSDEGY